MNKNSPAFRYVDLFAGIGGFAAALDAFGGTSIYAVEKDKEAANVYRLNWGSNPLGDITLDANEQIMAVGAHEILVAGFPCQPFSKSGAQKGMEETRGTLYFNILQIIKARHPLVVVLENVRNLYGPRHMHEWQIIIQTLRDEGYVVADKPAIVSPHQIPPTRGGRPQHRERVFITATYSPKTASVRVPEPVFQPRESVSGWSPENWNLYTDLPVEHTIDDSDLRLSSQERAWIRAWDDWVKIYRKASGGKKLPGFPIWTDEWIEENKVQIPQGTPAWKKDFILKNAKLYSEHKEVFDEWLDKHQIRTNRFPASRRKFEWQAQDAKNLSECVLHFRPSGLRVKKANYVPALVAITQTTVLCGLGRRISPREAARLQGLPEWFDFGEQSNAATYKQLGNGVNVGVVWNVIKRHVERDRTLLTKTERGKKLVHAIESSADSPDRILEKLGQR